MVTAQEHFDQAEALLARVELEEAYEGDRAIALATAAQAHAALAALIFNSVRCVDTELGFTPTPTWGTYSADEPISE